MVITLLLVALSLGLSNFAGAIGIGVSGVSARTRIEVGVVFGLFEVLMPIVGLLIGHRLADDLGGSARWIGGGLLIATGLTALIAGLRPDRPAAAGDGPRRGRLVLTGLALSIDNLVVGFALGTAPVSVVWAAVVIGLVSVALSLVGLELGARLGRRMGDRAEVVGAAVLIAVGIAIAIGLL
jgi:manganese efflux pump family protein